MQVYGKRISLPLPWAILVFFALLILIFWLLIGAYSPAGRSWLGPDGHMYVIASGLVPGLVVAVLQFLFSWFEYREIGRLRNLGVKEVLVSRDDEGYYRALLVGSAKRIWVMGVTASRFLDDFAVESPRREKKVLVDALERGVEVRIIIASEKFLESSDNPGRSAESIRRMKELKRRYSRLFDYRIYHHAPAHIIVVVDNNCLVGPKFPGIPSKDTPVVHAYAESIYASTFLKYFESEWGSAERGG